MTDKPIHCDNRSAWLHPYLDNELDMATVAEIAAHLDQCDECHARYLEMQALSSGLHEHAPYFAAPDALVDNVLSSIRRRPFSLRLKLREFSAGWLAPSFSLAALAAAALLYVSTPTTEDMWVDEAISGHIRSLMEQHLTDVQSSDKHTVKPWFAGKIDFSPPVYDFTAQGFPLIGGRLDYLQHQTVAALSYRRNKHIINLFIMPTTQADSEAKVLSRRGYNIIAWQKGHMAFRTVSDLNAEELKTLSVLIAQGGS